MPDMLVKLYELPGSSELLKDLAKEKIRIHRALAPDKERVLNWVGEHSTAGARSEADVCFANQPISLFLATRKREILGFACYNATAKNFFGPTHVLKSMRGKGIGKALLIASLEALKAEGYAYAIIGGVGPAEYYEKMVGATIIEGSTPGIYRDYLGSGLVFDDE